MVLRIGVLGCANIARQFTRDVADSKLVKVTAVASRDLAKAKAFAADFKIGVAYGSYEALLADPTIDAIYNPLPNSLHASWSIKAAEAKKHILCEKPLCTSQAEAIAMFDAAAVNGVMLLEAYPWWFQPQTADLVKLVKEIGEVRHIQVSFGFNLAKPEGNIRMAPDLGGGAIGDVGSYCCSLIRLVMGEAPVSINATSTLASTGVDISTTAQMTFKGGAKAQLECSMNTAYHRGAVIVGTHGVIETEYLNHTSTHGDPRFKNLGPHPWGYVPSKLRIRRGAASHLLFEDVYSPVGSGFRFAAEAFAKVIADKDFAAIDRAKAASIDIAGMLETMSVRASAAETPRASISAV